MNVDILHKIMTPLSNFDIMNSLKDVKIVPYSDLHKYKCIKNLLGKYKKVILLYQTSKNFGHWTCLYEYNNEKYYYIIYDIQILKS
jgi:predicted component of viral defense system (DUF524 family)